MKKSLKLSLILTLTLSLGTLSACGGGGESATESPSIKNKAPIPNAGNDITVTEGDTVTLNGSGIDTDGTVTAYEWIQKSGPSITIANSNLASTTFTAPSISVQTAVVLTLKVTDNNGATGIDDIHITINNDTINNIAEAIESLESSGLLPKLNTSNELSGNNIGVNGIREDINDYITSIQASNDQIASIQQMALGLQSIMELDLDDDAAIEQVDAKIMIASQCLTLKFSNPADAYKHLKKLEAYTANTKARAEQYNAYNAKLDGSVSRLSDTPTCQ